MIDLDLQNEKLKFELCSQEDFSIHHLFDQFNTVPRSMKDFDGISITEFKKQCLEYSIKPDEIDCALLLTKFQEPKSQKHIFLE